MKPEWAEYFESIGLIGEFLDRARQVVDFYTIVCEDEIDDVFVSEYVDDENNRHYESMWLFSENRIAEAKSFLTEDRFDSAIPRLKYWELTKRDYEFDETTKESRLNVRFSVIGEVSGELKASAENCSILKNVFLKHILGLELKWNLD